MIPNIFSINCRSNVIILSVTHLLAVYGFLHALIFGVKIQTMIWTVVLSFYSGIGIIVGAHRLYSHRSFKATWPLRLFLVIGNTMSMSGTIFSYARDHILHHKYSD